ncbi:MAG: phosphomannose isomerase type II C-terminal cupin domain [Abditibacteriales bacterium]|nr:phosphomannose isomerase type II C-terminal cupin domain [Abditibacteriales bacterium]MDW8365010.1 phosphomannose isomerase type II C-terminal cupin domain [Abditibacteriales bacterium]
MPNSTIVVEKPWGRFVQYTLNEPSTVKILEVEEGHATSLQSHRLRDERWIVLDGEAEVCIGDDILTPALGAELFIPRETKHRLAARRGTVRVLEISLGFFDENDIVRYEDVYGRVTE